MNAAIGMPMQPRLPAPRRIVLRGAGPAWQGLCGRPEQLLRRWQAILGRLGEPLHPLPDGVAQGGRALQFLPRPAEVVVRCTGLAWTQRELAPFKVALADAARAAGATAVQAQVEF